MTERNLGDTLSSGYRFDMNILEDLERRGKINVSVEDAPSDSPEGTRFHPKIKSETNFVDFLYTYNTLVIEFRNMQRQFSR